MRIVIDLQGAQSSGSRHRGIGRYSLALTKAIARNRGNHEVIVALNGLFPDSVEPIRCALYGALPQENIRVWQCPDSVSFGHHGNEGRRRAAELIRESFLYSLKPDVIHISSLFEGLIDDAITSVGLLGHAIPTSITLYDLIPLIHKKKYLGDPVTESWYLNKIGHLRRADLWLAISESSRREGIEYLSLPDAWTVNASTAADPQFRCMSITEDVKRTVCARYGLVLPFILYTGGIDHRKNIEELVRAFGALPRRLRDRHQLAVVCSVQPDSRLKLEKLARECGLEGHQLVMTGFVSDGDMVCLYNICKMFVFPSWHEGFGLPALEAMACGAPTIAADSSSLPEVIGRSDALFDPFSQESIAAKIRQVLDDVAFRSALAQHGTNQARKFSWDESARRAITAFERLHGTRLELQKSPPAYADASRPKLAFISPLPPSRSGIADYSAELLPELARYYDIDVIVAKKDVREAWIRANCEIRTADWFLENAQRFDRILYHFGNSDQHTYMFTLLDRVPGIVVLHDFFLSSIVSYLDIHSLDRNALARELYRAHGYPAVHERFHANDPDGVVWNFPCNLGVLRKASGVIVHSEHALQLANHWYGPGASSDWRLIPLLRCRAARSNPSEVRKQLGFPSEAVIVSSFGGLGPLKLNHRLLQCWVKSRLAQEPRGFLVFAGESDNGAYGDQLAQIIRNSGCADRILITGRLDTEGFKSYLAVTDIAVQLRTLSRGETSATALDCMNYGLPTIVNAHGSMAEIESECVLKLDDEFEDVELIAALDALSGDGIRRAALGNRGRQLIAKKHDPRSCASLYTDAIEAFCRKHAGGRKALIRRITEDPAIPADSSYWAEMVRSIAASFRPGYRVPQLLVDVSELVWHDAKTGIQRVVKGILAELLSSPPSGYRVEPVYACKDRIGYCYAREFTMQFLKCPNQIPGDLPVEAFPEDVFLGLDFQPHVIPRQSAFYANLRNIGVKVHFVVYDLLPVLLPHRFMEGSTEAHVRWLETIQRSDGAMCISRAVADDLLDWLSVFGEERHREFQVGWFHLGASVKDASWNCIGPDTDRTADHGKSTFLMVSTIEPRKGHAQVLEGFDLLWRSGFDVNLIIVGKLGWMVEGLDEKIRAHNEFGRRLHWLESVSDARLAEVYSTSDCLIAASEGEGFGLPLVEAAEYSLPIIARDIPVFREVSGENALYFSGDSPDSITKVVVLWLQLKERDVNPRSTLIPRLTWRESADQLLEGVLRTRRYRCWMPSVNRRFWGSDPRLLTQVGRRVGRNMVSDGRPGCLVHGPYIRLEPGSYRVLVKGTVVGEVKAEATVDIAVSGGARVLAQIGIDEQGADDNLAILDLSLPDVVEDLEIRVWANNEAAVAVSSIEIQPTPQSETIPDSRDGVHVGTESDTELALYRTNTREVDTRRGVDPNLSAAGTVSGQ